MVKARKYVLIQPFKGLPKRSDYDIVEHELPPLEDGEVLVKTEWISVDPYLRIHYLSNKVPFDQCSFQIGQVIESKNSEYPTGTRIISEIGWCDYGIVKFSTTMFGKPYKLPNLGNLPASLALGAFGMPGATAYFGLLEICKPKLGDTIVITGAAGAVGSIVGQIAKIKGCKVIGFTGNDDKVKWLENEVGFDKAFNYKTVNIVNVLCEFAPNGIDCFFDNVGGEVSSIVMTQMKAFGKVACCGYISSYNEDPSKMPKATVLQPTIIWKELKVEGFICTRWRDRWEEAFAELIKWTANGDLKPKEHVIYGFDNIFDAFVSMLTGNNYGKVVVKL